MQVLRDFEREAELLDGLRHDSIIALYGISINQEPLLILEYMEHGDLNKFLRSEAMLHRLHVLNADVAY